MERIAKRVLVVLAVELLLLILVYSVRGYLEYRANTKIAAALEVTYQAQLARFQHALPLGTARSEVEKYLASQGIPFTSDGHKWISVNLGNEPGSFVCARWEVSVEFEFDHEQRRAQRSSVSALTAITLKKVGDCW